jgi:hypothetical protein
VLVVELDGKHALDELLPGLEVRHIAPAVGARGVPARARLQADREAPRRHRRDRRGRHGSARHRRPRGARQDQAARTIGRVGRDPGRRPRCRARDHVPHERRRPARRGRGGPVHAQADEVLAMLADPERCQVVLVTLPETTPVNELVETAYAVEERVGVRARPGRREPGRHVGEPVPDPAGVSTTPIWSRRHGSAARALGRAGRRARAAGGRGRLPRIVLARLRWPASPPPTSMRSPRSSSIRTEPTP